MDIYNYKIEIDYIDKKYEGNTLIQDGLYRNQLLKVFNIDHMDKLTEKIEILYRELCKSKNITFTDRLNEILDKNSRKVIK